MYVDGGSATAGLMAQVKPAAKSLAKLEGFLGLRLFQGTELTRTSPTFCGTWRAPGALGAHELCRKRP